MRGDPTKSIGIRIPLRLIPVLTEDAAALGRTLSAHLAALVVDQVENEGRAYARTLRGDDAPEDEPVADYSIGPKAVAEREPVKQETVAAAVNHVIHESGTRHHHIFVADGETYERGTRVRVGHCGVCGEPMASRR